MKLLRLARTEAEIAQDHARLLALWQAAGLPAKPLGRDSLEAFEAQQASGLQAVLGVEDEAGVLIGCVIATHDGRKGWINRLAVHPAQRGKGIAGQLIAAAEEHLRSLGITVTAAMIESGNEASLRAFLKAGYEDHQGWHYVSKRPGKDS